MATHILVIGATVAQGYKLTLYVRNSDKLPDEISGNANVSVVKGTLDDISSLQQAACSGPTVFISFAGPVMGSNGTPVTDAMQNVFPILIVNNYKRALVLGTCSFSDLQDKSSLKWKASILLFKTIAGSAYQEFNELGAFVSSQDVSQLKWTFFRVPFLTNSPAASVNATFVGSGSDGMSLSRKSMAAWILNQLPEDSEWVGKAPTLSN